MTQKSILISGASSGIGKCVAHGLAERGWQVFAGARSADGVRRLEESGLQAVLLDVSNSESIRQAVDYVLNATDGKLDALFNNAGYGQLGAIEDVSRLTLREQFETNLFGAWELTALVLPIMRRQAYGRILFTSSILGFCAVKWYGAYNASKFAMEGMCDTLRIELQNSGIYVSLIEPGPIFSNFRSLAKDNFLKNIEIEKSQHKQIYQQIINPIQKKKFIDNFALPPKHCLHVCLKALNSERPAARYRVTLLTKMAWYLKRVLPSKTFDFLLSKLS